MNEKFEVSFEIFHLIAMISLRLNKIFDQCGLSREKMYALAYVDRFGKDYELKGNTISIFQRSRLVKVVMNACNCDRTKTNSLINTLANSKFLGKHTLTSEERRAFFNDGQNEVLYLTRKGKGKIDKFISKLQELSADLAGADKQLLRPPDAEKLGNIATGVVLFLRYFIRTKKVRKKASVADLLKALMLDRRIQ